MVTKYFSISEIFFLSSAKIYWIFKPYRKIYFFSWKGRLPSNKAVNKSISLANMAWITRATVGSSQAVVWDQVKDHGVSNTMILDLISWGSILWSPPASAWPGQMPVRTRSACLIPDIEYYQKVLTNSDLTTGSWETAKQS